MGRVYFKELPLFHLYDSDLTGTQKLLMTLLFIDNRTTTFTNSAPCAKLRVEDVIFDLKELKRRGYFQE